MDSAKPYYLFGALGSPYSMKMRAVFRYRRIPHIWRQAQMGDETIFKNVKAPVIPIIQYPDGNWHNDSTPMIFELERLHSERSVVPPNAGDAFLAYLLEDFADEWGTKAMFHYRWYRERDQKQMSEWLSFDRLRGQGLDIILKAAKMFRERQVGRMALVGCTPENAPVIEESANRVMAILEDQVPAKPYFFGTRPSLAEFSWFRPAVPARQRSHLRRSDARALRLHLSLADEHRRCLRRRRRMGTGQSRRPGAAEAGGRILFPLPARQCRGPSPRAPKPSASIFRAGAIRRARSNIRQSASPNCAPPMCVSTRRQETPSTPCLPLRAALKR